MASLYKTQNGKTEILNLYNQKLSELNLITSTKTIQTSFGETNVLIAGDTSKPPLLVVHGSNGCAPIALETYIDVKDSFCIYAVDVLAQPNKSDETRLSMKDNSYGKWVNELIDSLELKNITLTGFSFGGLIILKTLLYNESNIKEVFLSAPAYIVNGNPIKAIFKFFIPLKRFMKTRKSKYINQFLNATFTEKDEFAFHYLSAVFIHFEMDFSPIPVIKANDAANIKTPITLIAADQDVIFPGAKMIKRAKKIFPSLKNTLLLTNSKHVQSKIDNKTISNLIMGKK